MKKRKLFLAGSVLALLICLWMRSQWQTRAASEFTEATATSAVPGEADFHERPDPWADESPTGSNVYGAEIPGNAFLKPYELTVLGQPLETSSGLSFSCVRFDNMKVYCWGDNQWGQLGDGSFVNSIVPVQVQGLDDVVSVAALHKHVCALTSAGAVKCWGRNYHGELGNNSNINSSVPVDVDGLSGGVQQIAVGGFHACALLSDGGIKCWGYNFHGQLGDGTFGETADRWMPVDVVDAHGVRLTGFKAIFAGKYHNCALTLENTLQCWGYNADGQVGDGTSGRDADKHNPVSVPGLADVETMAMGERHSCVLVNSGGMKCWGGGYEGQLGFAPESGYTTIPTDVPGLTGGVVKIGAGVYHTCAVQTNGALECWGNNLSGQVGDGSLVDQFSPRPVVGAGNGVSQVSGGDSHTCAIINQRIHCWGSNVFGQIGSGQIGLFDAPTQPIGLESHVIAVSSGAYHNCALLEGGGVKCWGRNTYGQLGDGTTINRLMPVDVIDLGEPAVEIVAGGNHSCALLANNRIKCWGANGLGQLGNGEAGSSTTPVYVVVNPGEMEGYVHSLTAGWEHTCAAVNTDFWCWGANNLGQLGNDRAPIGSSEPVIVHGFAADEVADQIFAGDYHTCAFTTWGVAKCGGDNYYGQLGRGDNVNTEVPRPVLIGSVTVMATGQSHTCGIVTEGAYCWGFNASGQLGDQTAINRWAPVSVFGLSSGVSSMTAGGFSTCALLNDGSVKCWGDNGFAQLGNGTTFSRSVPVFVALPEPAIDISLGKRHACSVGVNGGVVCWGANDFGQMGNNSFPYQLTPAPMPYWYQQQLSADFTSGQPDSYFTFTGIDYPPGVTVTIQVNTFTFTQTLTVNSTGELAFQLHAPAGEEGYYIVNTYAVGHTRSLMLHVTSDAPLHPQVADDFFEIPNGIVYPTVNFIPLIAKTP